MDQQRDERKDGNEVELDEEIVRYFERIDNYQRQWAELAKCFSSGFMSLAQANYKSTTGRRYDSEYYDERMETIRGVSISEDGSSHKFDIVEFPQKEEHTPVDAEVKESEGLRQRKSAAAEKPAEETSQEKDTEEEVEVKPKIDPRDPLRWFGILVPQDLRDTQKYFTSGLSKCLGVLSTMSEISASAKRIEELQGKATGNEVDPDLLSKLEKVEIKDGPSNKGEA